MSEPKPVTHEQQGSTSRGSAFSPEFNCLWCGRPHRTRSDTDLEGWARLCPECIGRAQDNEFLRFRLREGLRRRSEAEADADSGAETGAAADGGADEYADAAAANASTANVSADRRIDQQLRDYYAARAGEYDDWYLRRGRYSRGPLADVAWTTDLDVATLWLDGLPMSGEIVELAAGTGWWSPLLAQKGQLSIYDAVGEPLDRARERLLAHGLAAHIHVRDAWQEPDRQVDGLFCGFWLSHVERARLGHFLAICRGWLKPGGMFAFIDSRPDPDSSARDHPAPADDVALRRLDDGREFTIPKIYYTPVELEVALAEAGFGSVAVSATPRFFLLGRATAE